MGRGRPARHNRAAEEDHEDQQAAGPKKALPGFGRHRRFRGPAGAPPPHRRRRPGHAVHPRTPHADKHVGLLAETATDLRRRAGQYAVHLRLATAQPAGTGGGAGGIDRAAAQAGAPHDVSGSHQGALQLLVHPLPEGQGEHVLQEVGGALSGGWRRGGRAAGKWGPSYRRRPASCWGAGRSSSRSAATSGAAAAASPRLATLPTGWDRRGVSEGSTASEISALPL